MSEANAEVVVGRVVVANEYDDPVPVHVVDVKMSFLAMVEFMLKWAIASIPAFLLLAVFFATIAMFGTFLLGMIGAGAMGI